MKIYMSGLARVMACAGSLGFKDLPQDDDRTKRDEGEAFGEYIERVLTMNVPIPSHAKNGTAFDDDMKFYAQIVCGNVAQLEPRELVCENQVHWMTRAGIELRGRSDISFIGADGKFYVDDVKYGWGLIEPEENWQLIAYAIGEVIKRNRAFDSITMRIHQPRPHHHNGPTREWVIGYDKLLEYKEKIEQRMFQIAEGFNELCTGPQCKYCPAAVACPAANKAYYRGVETVHEFLQDNMSDTELSFQLDLIDRVEEMVKTRKGSLELLAKTRIKDGRIVPNYITDSRYGNRSWTKNFDPEVIKMLTGIDVTKKEVLSPAQAEKLGLPEEITASMTERKFLGTVLKRADTTKLAEKIFGSSAPGAVNG